MNDKMKIYLATPAYDGKTHIQYTMSMIATVNSLIAQKHEVLLDISSQSTLLIAARNNFIRKFLETDCTHLWMVDSDLGWHPKEFLEFIKNVDKKDILGGIYPSRKEQTFVYNPDWGPNKSFKGDGALIKCDYIPSGFVIMKREAVQKMVDYFAHLAYESKSGVGDKGTLLFNTEVIDGEFWSEDYVFFRRAKEAGLECWIDPRITFDHAGVIGGLYLLPEVKEFLKKSVL